jgi:hypothetical protein
MGHAGASASPRSNVYNFLSLLFAIYAASSFRPASSSHIIVQITTVVWTSDSHVDILIRYKFTTVLMLLHGSASFDISRIGS